MIDFNGDWDEPDVWSTPTHSPLSHPGGSTSAADQLHRRAQSSTSQTDQPEPLSSSPLSKSPISSDESFYPAPNAILTSDSNSDTEPNTPKAHDHRDELPSYLSSSSQNSQIEPSSSSSKFLPPSLPTNSWLTCHQSSAPAESLSAVNLFDPGPSSGFDSEIGFGAFNPDKGSDEHANMNDDDEFGDFDDGDMVTGQDSFGGFTTTSPLPSLLPTMPVVPVKLPDQVSADAFRAALAPSIDALFIGSQSDSAQDWFVPTTSIPQNKDSSRSSCQSVHMPSILKSNESQRTWQALVDGGNGLGRPVEWKRSQIRRLHLVHLGIPVDLNDFLAPPPLAKSLLTINTDNASLSQNSKANGPSPTLASPFRGPMLDRKRCEELAGLSETTLSTRDVENLRALRDELKSLNHLASETLAFKQQQRDRSIQDCQSYNKMISDLVLAAQKIQMASPGSTKRASSIHLGSSSISGSSSKWPSLASHRNNDNHSSNGASINGRGGSNTNKTSTNTAGTAADLATSTPHPKSNGSDLASKRSS